MLPYSAAYLSPFETNLIDGVIAQSAARGYNLMLYTATDEQDVERAIGMVDRRVDGLILVMPPIGSPLASECERQGICTAAILAGPETATITVNSDDFTGGLLATRHLIERGHHRIAHLFGRQSVLTSEPRRRGYECALKAAGIERREDLCLLGDFTFVMGLEATRCLLRLPEARRPTAIFAANDPSAHGAIEAIHEAGLRVPDDISVVGYDDTWYATVIRPTLTSVSMQVREMGLQAADILISHLEGEDIADHHPVLPVSLTLRESTGFAPGVSNT